MGIIEVKKLSFGYNGNEDIIKNINIDIKEGEFVCIVGENGSGKSTLIKCILGLNKGHEGTVEIHDRIGYLSQMTEIQNNFPATIEEVVLSGTIANGVKRIFYNKEDKIIAKEIMEKFELYDIRKQCFRELSGGQKQRVLIARAMCSTGKILILDEPVNGVDPNMVKQIYKVLEKLKKEKGLTIVMISHDTHRVIPYCDRVIEMVKGKITFNDVASKYTCPGGGKQ